MKFTTLLFCLIFSWQSFSQETQPIDTLRRVATIEYNTNGNDVDFTPNAPELNQIAGAPKAFYSHYWEFGDGEYSKEANPKHTYKKAGEYEVKLWSTNNYDTGKPPTSRPKKLSMSKDADSESYTEVASMTSNLNLQRNTEPMPEEEIVVIMSYKNTKDYATNGKLHLFYNEQKFKANNFELTDTRTHHSERASHASDFVYTYDYDDHESVVASIEDNIAKLRLKFQDTTERQNLPLTLEESKAYYKDASVLEFDNMMPNEERNVFYTLKTTPEMLKDTSAIISVRGVYIPDDNFDNHNVKEMEMEIVTSHDPNKMSTTATFLNYRLVRFKRPKFKIKFQNNGEGPASTIRLETDIPDMFDKTSIRVEDMYPKCKICPKREVEYSCLDTTYTETQAIFTFKNIYLPGSEQKNVKEYDSTKGFVKYSLKFGKDFHKQKTKSKTAIIFDKNDPIITNYSTTRFLPGISIGAKVGYNSYANLDNSKSYFFGATLSPYKSYKWYWQVELLNSFHSYDGNKTITVDEIDTAAFFGRERTTVLNTYDNVDWEIPILARYNVNNFIGLGAGLQGAFSLSEKTTNNTSLERAQNIDGINYGPYTFVNQTSIKTSNSFNNFRTGLLFEATAGFARIGPSVGARYIINFKEDFNYWQFYAIWKF